MDDLMVFYLGFQFELLATVWTAERFNLLLQTVVFVISLVILSVSMSSESGLVSERLLAYSTHVQFLPVSSHVRIKARFGDIVFVTKRTCVMPLSCVAVYVLLK